MHWLHDISAVLPRGRAWERRDPAGIDTVVLHCTAMPRWNVWDVARYHVGPNHISPEGCPTIGYAYFVEPDGLMYACLSHDVRAWHVGTWNERSIGVCLAYDAGPALPPPFQLPAAVELCAMLVKEFHLSPDRVLGHRELEGTGYTIENGKVVLRKECPGLAIDMDRFRRAVAAAIERPAGPEVRRA